MVKLSKKIKNDPRKQMNKNIEDGIADIKVGLSIHQYKSKRN